MPALETRDIQDIELLRLGRWKALTGPVEITQDDLDALLSTYRATQADFVPRLKLGHNEAQRLLSGFLGGHEREDGRPAAGWIANLRRRGSSLFADFKAVPARLADMIEAGAWADRSVEIDRDCEIAGRRYPLLLRAVALLGETPAAIGGLNDFAKLYASSADTPSLVIYMAAGEPGTPDELPGDDPDPQPPERGTTPDGGDTMKLSLTKELLAALGLPDDATADEAEARMLELAAKAMESEKAATQAEDGTVPDPAAAAATKPAPSPRAEKARSNADAEPAPTGPATAEADAPGSEREPAPPPGVTLEPRPSAATPLATLTRNAVQEAEDEPGTGVAHAPSPPALDREAIASAFDGLRSALLGEVPLAAGSLHTPSSPTGQSTNLSAGQPAGQPAVQMSAGEVEALRRVAELESQVASREAERRVDADMSDNDQGVIPPAVRDRLRPHLIRMAASGETDGYQAVLGGITRVRLSEKGSAKAGPLSSIELTREERRICRDHSMDYDEYRRAKAKRLGIKIKE